jgi:hypothetical protein
MEAVECGAAALAMILAYHGRCVSLEELRVASGVSRDGSKASNILRAARRYGLAARGFRKEPEQLLELPLPSIIHSNFNHFVVFEGVKGEFALINDPSSGRRRVSLIELSEGFTGVALAFEVTSEFRREGAPSRVSPMLWRQLAGSRAGLALIVLLSLTLVLPGIIVPVFSKLFVDQVLIGRRSGWVAPLDDRSPINCHLAGADPRSAPPLFVAARNQAGADNSDPLFLARLAFADIVFCEAPRQRCRRENYRQRRGGKAAVGRLCRELDDAWLFRGSDGSLRFRARWDRRRAWFAQLHSSVTCWAQPRRRRAALAQDRAQLTAATVGAIHSIETVKSAGLELDAFSRWAGFHAKAMAAAQELDRETTLSSSRRFSPVGEMPRSSGSGALM